MCGIHGSLGNDKQLVLAMAKQASHRGPDQTVIQSYNNTLTLGHNRLSIVDLSTNGSQPMTTNNGRFTIVFNGEIYNAPELKQELLQNGTSFKGTSDTEVLLYAYETWGSACVEKLRGMWAFAIYDRHNQTIFLSRDPFGIKPLYIYETSDDFIFSSEIRSILQHPLVKKTIDKNAIQDMLLLGYIVAPRTIITNISSLLPGEQITYSIHQKKSIRKIISLEAPTKEPPSTDELKAALIDSVKHHLISDVPVGLFLSGGIDSSVLAVLLKELNVHLHGFSIGIDGKKDLAYAKEIADLCNIPLTSLELSRKDITDMIPELLTVMDQPLADSSLLATMAVSKLASQKVKVVLSGEGGDELFAGYTRAQRLSGLSADIERSLISRTYASTLQRVFPLFPQHVPLRVARGLLRRLETLRGDALGLFITETTISNNLVDSTSVQQRMQKRILERETTDRGLAFDRLIGLPDKLLLKADTATMAYSIEGRVPLLDKKLFSLVGGAPNEWKRSGNLGKIPLREILKQHLPSSLFDRPKEGFSIPVSQLLADYRNDIREALNWYQQHFQGISPAVDATINSALYKNQFEHMFSIMRHTYYAIFILAQFTKKHALSC